MKRWNDNFGETADHLPDSGQKDRSEDKPVHSAAVRKAMNLLLHRDRTERELRSRLEAGGFPADEIDDAIAYTASFGYVNDRRYAENYAVSFSGKKSRRMIAADLRQRGVDEIWIEEAVASLPEDESDQIMDLIRKRAGEPHVLDAAEKRRLHGYLARRGFGTGEIVRAIRSFERNV